MVDQLGQSHFELLILLFFSLLELTISLVISFLLFFKFLSLSVHFFLVDSIQERELFTAFTLDIKGLILQLTLVVSKVVLLVS
jgi:hypothetical protein